MTEQHPITPSPELVQQWFDDFAPKWFDDFAPKGLLAFAIQAARWGADQELKACVNYVDTTMSGNKARALRAARRPKPPSLAEQALAELDQIPTHDNEGRTVGGDVSIIRAALERLHELESDG